tara:strand:- start:1977 stop:2762 length:786 start_codon:yes stop_codon:yes gene_type:complete
MKIPIYQVDAFASKIFKGNPAAICPLNEWLPDEIMQNIAMENNLSETAFYIQDNEIFYIRWFTPKAELDLAGHPTLATAHILFTEFKLDKKKLIFKTKIGDTLNVFYKDKLYFMDFPSRPPKNINNIDLLNEALGKKPKELLAHRDLIAVFENQDDVISINPNMEKLKKLDYPSVVITSKGSKSDFVSRNFAPKLGIPEDPVTGSSHCELIPYWSQKLNKKTMLAFQLSERGGEIYCNFNDSRVSIGGEAITFLKGEIEIS